MCIIFGGGVVVDKYRNQNKNPVPDPLPVRNNITFSGIPCLVVPQALAVV